MGLIRSRTHILIAASVLLLGNIRLSAIRPSDSTKQSWGYAKDSLLNFTEITARYGYISEEHTVVTQDGYYLTVFRIVRARKCSGPKHHPPVILMHGLLLSADAWLDAGPKAGLAYLLSDSCYDLWVGNQRGNYYSRRHRSLDPDKDAEFWNFSVDEIGLYDIPATIDYVLKRTRSKQVNYVGFSQGAGTLFIMCSERPGYCDKVNLFIGLAPAARQTNTKSIPYRSLCIMMDKLKPVLGTMGYNEVLAKGAPSQEFLSFLCHFRTVANYVCPTFADLFDSVHPGSITAETTRVLFGHFPAGTSLKNMARYGQSMMSKYFEKYNYGSGNMGAYGQSRPPVYNLSAVTSPTVIVYGRNDHLVDPKDIKWLVERLPNVEEVFEVADPLWNHLDVTYSQYTDTLIYPIVNEYLLKYSVV